MSFFIVLLPLIQFNINFRDYLYVDHMNHLFSCDHVHEVGRGTDSGKKWNYASRLCPSEPRLGQTVQSLSVRTSSRSDSSVYVRQNLVSVRQSRLYINIPYPNP